MGGLVFVQITFEKWILIFFFENTELQPLLAWDVSAYLRIFMQLQFQ